MRVSDPIVSVVVPTYNRARDLQRCLDSLRRQTRTDFEVIVCDDGSTDDTPAVVKSFASELDITYDTAPNWGGPARPRNRGIARARASYVAFLDADDWWTPRKLEVSLPALERGADVVYHHLYMVRRAHQRVFLERTKARDLTPPVFLDLLSSDNALPNSSVVARRSLLIDIGGMPEDRSLIAMEDYVCWLNAAKATDRFERIPGTHGYYWAAGGNISGAAKTLRHLDILEDLYGDVLRPAQGQPPAWIAYLRGRAQYRLGEHAAARRHLSLVRRESAPLLMWAKAALLRAILTFWRRAS
jgi:glycosyltransferase involved in cell wall biosynthesis